MRATESASEPSLDYPWLLARVLEMTGDVRSHSVPRSDLREAEVALRQ